MILLFLHLLIRFLIARNLNQSILIILINISLFSLNILQNSIIFRNISLIFLLIYLFLFLFLPSTFTITIIVFIILFYLYSLQTISFFSYLFSIITTLINFPLIFLLLFMIAWTVISFTPIILSHSYHTTALATKYMKQISILRFDLHIRLLFRWELTWSDFLVFLLWTHWQVVYHDWFYLLGGWWHRRGWITAKKLFISIIINSIISFECFYFPFLLLLFSFLFNSFFIVT